VSGGLGLTDLTFGDFNEDGDVDIALAGLVKILLGNGDGTFAAPIENASGGSTVEVGDFDNDGTQDLVTGTQNSASIFIGNGDGTFAPAVSYPAGSGYTAAIVGDFDGNGDQDIADVQCVRPECFSAKRQRQRHVRFAG
jgi:hypothetical protein